MAAEMVWVSPGMLATKVMVAPNSPSALAKQSTTPAMRPGSASGSVTVRNTQMRFAPERRGGLLQAGVDGFDREPDRPHHAGETP